MEIVKEYLSNATIHGLSHIASTKGLAQTLWFCVVSVCVAYAGISIGFSFDAWSKNKITTTIETLPISEVIFPKVTVCPPKNTFTNLNYDLMRAENVTLNNSTQNALVKDFIKKVIDWKVSKENKYYFFEENKERNRYHGLSDEKIIMDGTGTPRQKAEISTSVLNGSITTPKYNELFDIDIYNDVNEGFLISIVYDYFNLTNSSLELRVEIEHNLHNSQTLMIDLETQNIKTNPFVVRFPIQQRKNNRNEKVNCIHVSSYGQHCQKHDNRLEILLKQPKIDEKEMDTLKSANMT